MIHSGLVSVTFRQLELQEIVALAARAGLDAIEWGGDVHVPPGDLARVRQARRMTQDAGLVVSSYGSYYRVGMPETGPFESALETAVELGAPTIRVWAGQRGSGQAEAAYRAGVILASQCIADLAARAGVTIAYEFHANTLTDTTESARDLLLAAARDNIKCYWQPPHGATVEHNLASLQALSPWLGNLHVFCWRMRGGQVTRLPLAAGAQDWLRYLPQAAADGHDRFALIEFVAEDAPEQFLQDARTLKQWLTRDEETAA